MRMLAGRSRAVGMGALCSLAATFVSLACGRGAPPPMVPDPPEPIVTIDAAAPVEAAPAPSPIAAPAKP